MLGVVGGQCCVRLHGALKSGMRYQLILNAHPKIYFKKSIKEKLFKILESEDSYVEVYALIDKM